MQPSQDERRDPGSEQVRVSSDPLPDATTPDAVPDPAKAGPRYACLRGCGYVLPAPGNCPMCGSVLGIAPPPSAAEAGAPATRAERAQARRWAVLAAAIFTISCFLPITDDKIFPRQDRMLGFVGLLFGWVGFLSVRSWEPTLVFGAVAWLANLPFAAALLQLLRGRSARVLPLGIAALALAAFVPFKSLRVGYAVWLASFATIAYAGWRLRR